MKFENWWADTIPPHVYHLTVDTGELVSVSAADPSPREPGVWLLPGHATFEAPPTVQEPYTAVFRDGAWSAELDYRGEVWLLEGAFVVVKALGDPASWGCQRTTVHDAQYVTPDGSAEDRARIHVWINDIEIEIDDNPALVERQVLAAWESMGEAIRPVSYDESAYEPVLDPSEDELLQANADAALAFDALLDERVAAVLERRQQEETTP